MRITLIVAAGGSGSRFRKSFAKDHKRKRGAVLKNQNAEKEPFLWGAGSKLFYPLLRKPLLFHTLSSFQTIPHIRETIVAIPKAMNRFIRAWARQYDWSQVSYAPEGRTRAESVWHALKKAKPESNWIMVHDGARPFISASSIKKIFQAVNENSTDGVILAKRVVPTIKQVSLSEGRIETTLDRNCLYEAETPQLVRRSLLEKAYAENSQAFQATDEAALLESVGACVKVVPHEAWNPKITTFEDLELAEAYLSRKEAPGFRIGFGRDTHRLVPGRKLYVGGIHIPSNRGALGHSDGDTLLHAVADAMLGAVSAGDIGEHFSDKDKRFKGIRSGKIIRGVLEKVRLKGWLPLNVDSVIILEKPRLGVYKKRIQENIAKLLKLEKDAVSIKAKTLEGLGPEGEGLAITCEALVTMRKI